MQDAFAAFLFALDAMTPSAYSYRIKRWEGRFRLRDGGRIFFPLCKIAGSAQGRRFYCSYRHREHSCDRLGRTSVDHDGSHHSHRSGHMATEHSAALVEMELAIQRELQRLGGEVDFMSPADFEAASAALRSTLRAHAERVERLELLAAAQERPADGAEPAGQSGGDGQSTHIEGPAAISSLL